MRQRLERILLLGLLAVGCTSPTAQPLSSTSLSTPHPSDRSPSLSPSPASAQDIRFLLADSYPAGNRIDVRIENVGDVAYRYQLFYPACYLTYFDSQGREFIIPPGTHCDIVSEAHIKPGEIKKLFKWDLDECTKDTWGCVRSRPLDPGTYTVQGSFKSVGDGSRAKAEATFDILASY